MLKQNALNPRGCIMYNQRVPLRPVGPAQRIEPYPAIPNVDL